MKEMLAAVARDFSGELELVKLPVPTPSDGEALIKVFSTGICHSDLHVLKDEVKFPRPAVLGHEVMGEIVEKFDSANLYPEISSGDLVISCFIMPCDDCANCRSGRSNLCSDFFAKNRLEGSMLDGTKRLKYATGEEIASYSMAGFAEYAIVPLSAVAKAPREKSQSEWCVLGCAGVTAYSALKRAINSINARSGQLESITIIGLGGVGIFMALFSKLLGFKKITAVDLDGKKLELAKELGATVLINVAGVKPEQIRNKFPEISSQVVLEAVGSSITIEMAMEFVAEGGQVIAVGIAPHGTKASIEITPLVRREFTLSGSFGGVPGTDLREVIALAEQGQIPLKRMVTHRYNLSEINSAFQSLDNKQTLGRSIIEFQGQRASK